MLSVIIDAQTTHRSLPALLAQLTEGAVDGLIREVLIVAPAGESLVEAVCDQTGAEHLTTVEAALQTTKSAVVLAMAGDFRFREGWVEKVRDYVGCGGAEALVLGRGGDGLLARFRAGPAAVLIERNRGVGLQRPDLERLRAELGLRPVRIG